MYYPVLSPELEAIGHKFSNLTSFIWLRRKIKNINNISLKVIMLTDNNQIFRNCFVIIYCHLTKVSSQINKCIIFGPNGLSITLSTLWWYLMTTLKISADCFQLYQPNLTKRNNILYCIEPATLPEPATSLRPCAFLSPSLTSASQFG